MADFTNNESSTSATAAGGIVHGNVGTTVASATTITISDFITPVSGTATVETVSGMVSGGVYALVSTGGFTISTAGNLTGFTSPYTTGTGEMLIIGFDGTSGRVSGFQTTADLSPLTTKGDTWVFSTVDAREAVGTDGYRYLPDSTTATGHGYFQGPRIVATDPPYLTPNDGVTDATAAWNTIMAAVPSGGTEVFFPAGTYLFAGTTITPPAGTTIRGAGKATIFLRAAANLTNQIIPISTANVTVQDLEIDGNYPATAAASTKTSLYFNIGATGGRAFRVSIVNPPGFGIVASDADITIDSCEVAGVGDALVGGFFGIWHDAATAVRPRFVNNYIHGWRGNGIFGGTTAGSGPICIGNTFSGNHVQTVPTGGGQLVTPDTNDSVVIGNRFLTGGGTSTSAIEANGGGNYTGNLIDGGGTSAYGIVAQAGDNYLISGNTIQNNTATGVDVNAAITNIEIVGNYFASNLTDINDGSGAATIAHNIPTSIDSTVRGAYQYTGNLSNYSQQVTAGTMTAAYNGAIRTGAHRLEWTNAMVIALGASLTGDITVCTLPAKTVVTNAYIALTAAASGTTTLTVSLGRVAGDYIDYIVASDAQAAANTIYGGTSGDRGTNLTGYDFPSLTATTAVKAHFVATGANLDQVLTSTGIVYLETVTFP